MESQEQAEEEEEVEEETEVTSSFHGFTHCHYVI